MARFASTIDNQPIYATRALNDKDGNQIDTTYAKLSDIPNVPVQDVTVDGTSVVNAQGVAEITTPTFTQAQADWTQADTTDPSYIQHKPNLAAVATSGDYSDLSNTPSIPTATSDLQNDSGFITASDIPVTDVEVDGVSVVSGGVASITMPTVPVTDVTVNGTSVLSNGVAAVTVPTATSDLTNDSGFITSSDIPAQEQADWTESDTSAPSYIAHKPTLAAVATSGDYSDLSNTPTINNVPAVTSSDDNKVLKASYTGGVGSYSWENETGTTYSAGVGIDITSNTIKADIDNSTIVPETNTVTGALTETDETAEYDSNSLLDSTLSNVFNSNSQAQVTIHIPGHTFDCGRSPLSASKKVAVCLAPMIDENNKWTTQGSFYLAADLTASYDEDSYSYLLDEQDVTVSAPVRSPDWYDWKSANNQPTATYYAMNFAIYTPGHESEQTPVYTYSLGDPGHTITYSISTATNKICVANPLPSSTSADATKVLTVDSNGEPGWASAQAPISAGNGIDITSNVVSAKVDGTTVTTNASGELTANIPVQEQSDWTETNSSDPAFILHKPTVKELTAGSNVTITEGTTDITISATDTTYTAGNGIDITNGVVSVDTSVVATQTDLADKQDTLTAGTNVSISNNVISATDTTYTAGTGIEISNNEISVETPVDIVAGPGIVIDNPDGNTLRVSTDENYETVLWSGDTGMIIGSSSGSCSLSESAFNFEKIGIYAQGSVVACIELHCFEIGTAPMTFGLVVSQYESNETIFNDACVIGLTGSTLSYSNGSRTELKTNIAHRNDRGPKIVKIVGIHRIANN